MSDEGTQTQSLDARRDQAVRKLKKRLVARGVNPDAAARGAEAVRPRIYVGDHGPIRVLKPLSRGEFYPGSFEDELAILESEIFYGIPDEEKLVATEARQAELQEVAEDKMRSGDYRL